MPELENLSAGKALVDSYDIENIRIEPILFQSGYLTLDAITETPFGSLEYRLRIPNREVQISFNEMLLDLLTGHTFQIPGTREVKFFYPKVALGPGKLGPLGRGGLATQTRLWFAPLVTGQGFFPFNHKALLFTQGGKELGKKPQFLGQG